MLTSFILYWITLTAFFLIHLKFKNTIGPLYRNFTDLFAAAPYVLLFILFVKLTSLRHVFQANEALFHLASVLVLMLSVSMINIRITMQQRSAH